jgi:heat shock protein HslJ
MPAVPSFLRRAVLSALVLGGLAACNMMPSVGSTADSVAVPATGANILGDWTIEKVEDRPVVDYGPARLSFGADGRVTGNASCNDLIGKFRQDGAGLSIGEVGTTRRLCPDAQMEQERRVLAALQRANAAALVGGMLELSADGKLLLRAAPASPARPAASAPQR